MIELELKGCRPQPLMSYLKALGVLRLIAEQVDNKAVSVWRNETFVLRSSLTADELLLFFTDEYTPTPIVGPWAGGSGFFGNDNRKAVDAIAASTVNRLEPYRTVIGQIRSALSSQGITTRPSGESKADLLRLYRRSLPDAFVQWMDAVLVLRDEGQSFPPLLGTGGNDGRLDFTRNFMQRLVDLGLDINPAEVPHDVRTLSKWFLVGALFDEPCPDLLGTAVGQFHPGGVGGPNASQGMEGPSLVNPWDFILMIEGSLVMAGALCRRMGSRARGKAVFPFTVSASRVGDGGMDKSDAGSARGEMWMPLWSRFAGLPEMSLVFSEGRAEIAGRQCRNGVELAQAVAGLGIDRGLSGFVRYGFLNRSGKAFLATPLGRFDVTLRPQVDLLREIEQYGWLDSFRRACSDKSTPARFTSALRRLDSAIMDYCRYGGTPFFGTIFKALGRIERELALLPGRPIGGREVRPVPSLSTQWIAACDDGSPEFRIAVALASVKGNSSVGPMSAHLEQTDREQKYTRWRSTKTGQEVWESTSLCQNMIAVLQRRLMDAARASIEGIPLEADCPVSLEDVTAFLNKHMDDNRIEEYLWSAILVRNPSVPSSDRVPEGTLSSPVSRAYCMLKLLFLPAVSALRADADGKPIRPEPIILTQLRAGNTPKALAVAARRLRVSGHIPMPGPAAGGKTRQPEFTETITPERLAAALLIPLQARDLHELKRTVIRGKTD
jgi:CRISPR-associated protein Csx17